jgi:hypothetical protein
VETGSFVSPGIDVPFGRLVTGADIHPSGQSLVLRTYTGAWEMRLDQAAGQTAEQIDASQLVQAFLGPLGEPQGEAISYDFDGTGLFTVSERPAGVDSTVLHHARCIQ